MMLVVNQVNCFVSLAASKGYAATAYVSKPCASHEYEVDTTETRLTGLGAYRFLIFSKTVRGVVFYSPKAHTEVEPVKLRIGACSGPFTPNQNLQKLGLLVYTSLDSGLLIIPTLVNSPLLVEVE